MQPRSPRQEPLLPTASVPPSPAVRQAAVLAHRQRVRHVLLAGLVAFAFVNAAWATHALMRAWRVRGSEWEQAHGNATAAAAAAADYPPIAAAREQAGSAADNAVMATMDAAAALSSAAGAVKHGAQAAGHAAGAALSAAKPLAGKASAVATKAATAVGSKAAQAAAGLVSNMTSPGRAEGTADGVLERPAVAKGKARSHQASSSSSSMLVKRAELTPPEVATASSDSCAQALGISKVALMFLVKGPMHHEQAWRHWFASAGGLLPVNATQAAVCGPGSREQRHQDILQACHLHQPSTAAAAGAAAAAAATGSTAAGLGALGAPAAAGDLIGQQHLFSVYIHAPPDFKGYPGGSLFAKRLIPRRIPTGWGDISLVEATRNLLWEAFRDPLNQRFILLSESDIPLYDPLTLHQQLLAEDKSRVNACLHNNRFERRWSNIMKTEHMNASHWRKSTQWIGLTRAHAELVLRDEEVYRSFESGCWSNWEPHKPAWRDCFPDEHYFATLFAVLGKEAEMECESWGVAEQDWSVPGAHPKSFRRAGPPEVTPELVHRLRGASCNSEAAFADAQRLYINAAAVLGSDQRRSCQALQDATTAAAAGYAHPLSAAACHLTARKFPNKTADAVLALFSPEVSCSAGGGGGLHLVSEHYCRKQQEHLQRGEAASVA
ncbi:hypothetical protein ABPG75_010035 [Micractinium tetrahymenae]